MHFPTAQGGNAKEIKVKFEETLLAAAVAFGPLGIRRTSVKKFSQIFGNLSSKIRMIDRQESRFLENFKLIYR